jgi:hypothetical protein
MMALIPALISLTEVSKVASATKELLAASTWKAAAAQMTLNWQLTLVIAAIGLVVGAVVLLANSYDKATKNLNKAIETSKEYKKTLEEVKSSA